MMRAAQRLGRSLKAGDEEPEWSGGSLVAAAAAALGNKDGKLSERAGDSGAPGNMVLSPFIFHPLWV